MRASERNAKKFQNETYQNPEIVLYLMERD